MDQVLLRRSYDYEEIRDIFLTPGIWECISDPFCECPETLPVYEEIYLIGEVDGAVIGLFVVDSDGKTCHIQVIPEHRKQWAIIFGKKCLQWCVHNQINKLRALIPFAYPNVMEFALRCGFEVIDSENKAWVLKWENSEK